MYDLKRFTLADMTRCGAELRRFGSESKSMEQAAVGIVRYLYERLGYSDSGQRCCVLVRFFKTHPYGDLGPQLQEFSRSMMPGVSLGSAVKCLTLLGTAGDRPEWNHPQESRHHRAIPLPSLHALEQVPMIAQLVRQFGLEVNILLEPKPEIIKEMDRKTYNVFYVEPAKDSLYIPAQKDFVVPNHVESVLGFGGVLPEGNFFAVIMFAKVPIPASTAEMFRTVALNVKLAILPFVEGPIFAG
ncbi:hypothetical protein [Candidatus Binatus sp.]|uniref:hypothetical protein n=1 Tax=Candidatus Binatus sp. TaxID=2811406 RepID=UPI00272B3C4E|nr:hypothetical protein [Candidatus Binatus sp.]